MILAPPSATTYHSPFILSILRAATRPDMIAQGNALGVRMISIHDMAALEDYSRRHHIDRHQLRQLRKAFYKRLSEDEETLQTLPEEQRSEFFRNVAFHFLRLHGRNDSQVDGASKLIFQTAKGLFMESVLLRIATGRTALCVSTQVGCAARCAFCATGTMGLAHNLSASEILDQVILANQQLRAEKRRIRNVTFMGMGEPLHNEEALYQAIEVLRPPRCFNLSQRHLLVSTVGIPEAMVRCAGRFPKVRLALSLHSARQEIRERIIPLARRYRLDELRDALAAVTTTQQQPVMIEYLMLKDLNDCREDAQALAEFLKGIAVHINLIPYNPIDGAPELVGTGTARRQAFAASLRVVGFKVTMRYSLGADIAAACGQLVRKENRRLALRDGKV
jgi:23S rRNA (adenine2503-C2)-methyltransferase